MTGKVERVHLRRAAYVYVRQSTMAQVERNTESLERQYELVDRAVALGWAAADVVVVDRDLGVSAKSTTGREGFERLVADVGLGKVGLVLGIEVSRLARRNADWYQLLDLCALTNTLIADNDGVYHPGLHNDRLLLGLKGTMSEAELHVLRTRMREGALHKVAKGELRFKLAAGFDYDELGRVRVTADEAVRDAIATVFAYFDEAASARQVMLRLVAEQRQLPRRALSDRRVRWAPASYRAVHDILTNPCYAGVYAFGRKRLQRTLVDGVVRERLVLAPREEWHAFLIGHHPGYITVEQYEANQARLRANFSPPRGDALGAAREGRALLQGLVRCGRCGRRMQVSYSGQSLSPRYSCTRGRGMYGTASCQTVGGRRIERLVTDAVFQALAPAAIDATLQAIEHLTDAHQARVRSAGLELERARQDANRARRQFDRCEPENRLVARTLESEWEAQLQNVQRAERQLDAVRARRPEPLNAEEIAWCRHAGADLQAVFDAPSTTHRDRKQLLRAMICEVNLTVQRKDQRALVRIVWEGGATTDHELTLIKAGHYAATDHDTLELVRRLATDYPDHQIAGILARQGRMTGAGKPFTAHRVRSLRHHHQIPAAQPRTPPPGSEALTVAQAAKALGVSTATVHRWLREGFITGAQMTRNAPWQIHITPELRARVRQHAPEGWLPLADAAAALGLARQTVLHKVQRGELPAIYAQHGKRKGLRIQVNPSQAGLFDNDRREEKQC
jgi:DNA invertase Pin-like site-specific DNA recombinase/predicted DNA-binding transcriptional regulator AlpA